jgi:hypothetical protein
MGQGKEDVGRQTLGSGPSLLYIVVRHTIRGKGRRLTISPRYTRDDQRHRGLVYRDLIRR